MNTAPNQPPSHLPFAGFWLRVAAFLIDSVVLYFPRSLVYWLSNAAQFTEYPDTPAAIVNLVIFMAYFSFLPSSGMRGTIGMWIIGLKVCDYSGRKISPATGALRSAGLLLSMILFFAGCIMCAFTKRKQALHDLMAKTYVIKRRAR